MALPDGRRKTVPGFASEHEASAWIIQAKRMIRDAGPWTPLAPRKPNTTPAAGQPSPTPPQGQQQQVQDTRNRTAARRAEASPAPRLSVVKS